MSDTAFEDITAAAAGAHAAVEESVRGIEPERADLLSELAHARHFARFPARDLTDEQAARRTTASELSLGGLIKHLTLVENNWGRFITEGPAQMPDWSAMTPADYENYADHFRLLPGETLQGVLDDYAKAATATDERVRTVSDLGLEHPLPNAPWFPPGATWTARRTVLHIIAETAQHAGHADIIRESLDGAKSMG